MAMTLEQFRATKHYATEKELYDGYWEIQPGETAWAYLVDNQHPLFIESSGDKTMLILERDSYIDTLEANELRLYHFAMNAGYLEKPGYIRMSLEGPDKYGYQQCSHCNGYGSSLKEAAVNCTACGGSGLVPKGAA